MTIVLMREPRPIPGVETISDLSQIDWDGPAIRGRKVFICGGAQVYQQALPQCSDLYLTLVKREVAGDTFFPPFEQAFELAEEVLDRPEFRILHYRNRGF
jgi:dihydrofolate reductase